MTEGVNSQGWLWNVWKTCAPQRVIAALLSWPWLVLGGRFCWRRISGGQQSVTKRLSLVRAKTDDPLIFLPFLQQAEDKTSWNFSLSDGFTFRWSVFVQVTAEKCRLNVFFLMLALLLGATAFMQTVPFPPDPSQHEHSFSLQVRWPSETATLCPSFEKLAANRAFFTMKNIKPEVGRSMLDVQLLCFLPLETAYLW